MNDKEIISCLRRLKDEGINYKSIAKQCEIPINQFYKCTYKRAFPLSVKQTLETYLFKNFKDIVYDEFLYNGRR